MSASSRIHRSVVPLSLAVIVGALAAIGTSWIIVALRLDPKPDPTALTTVDQSTKDAHRRIATQAAPQRLQGPVAAGLTLAAQQGIERALHGLVIRQGNDGAVGGPQQATLLPTVLACEAMLAAPPHDAFNAAIARALDHLLEQQQNDGRISSGRVAWDAYETAVALRLLALLRDRPLDARPGQRDRLEQAVRRAEQWLLTLPRRSDPTTDAAAGGVARSSPGSTPNLATTAVTLDAWRVAGTARMADDTALLLRYVVRCQALPNSNDQPWARQVETDAARPAHGGFVMHPARPHAMFGASAPACTIEDTLAGLLSLDALRVQPDDARCAAALAWLARQPMPWKSTTGDDPWLERHHLKLRLLAMTLRRLPPTLVDRHEPLRDWRTHLIRHVLARQKPDGSWVSEQANMVEGNPQFVTALSVLTLHECLQPTP